jgi:hypothetical protein
VGGEQEGSSSSRKPQFKKKQEGADATAAAQKEKESLEAVESCTVTLTADPHTGALCVSLLRGPTVAESWAAFRGRAQVVFVLVLPFLLIALYVASGHLRAWYTERRHAAWLVDFYSKNAPEVSLSMVPKCS